MRPTCNFDGEELFNVSGIDGILLACPACHRVIDRFGKEVDGCEGIYSNYMGEGYED